MNARRRRDRRPQPTTGQGPLAWMGLVLIFVAVLPYLQVIEHEFVNLDDNTYIYANPHVSRGLTAGGLRWAFTHSHGGHWHPLTWLSHMLDCELFGLEPAGHHLMNVLFHAANAALLLVVLHYMTGAFWPSACVAALFAVHPLRVESVAWAAERKDLLAGVFWMLVMLAYAWYARRPAIGRYLVVCASLALGLMAKPMLVTLPGVLLLLDVWPLARRALGWPRLVLEKVPLAALSAASIMVTIWAQGRGDAVVAVGQIPLTDRVANALVAYVAYLGKTIWPTDMACFYPHPVVSGAEAMVSLRWAAVGAGLFLAAVTVAVIYGARRRPFLAVGWFWYLGTLVPVIGLVQVGMQAMADRFTYLPMIGVCILVAWGVKDLAARWTPLAQLVKVAMPLCLAALMVVTWVQVGTWRDSRTLFEHALAVTDNNYLAHNNLAIVLAAEDLTTEAAAHFEEAIRINPAYPMAYYRLGRELEKQKKLDEAAARYRQAIEIDPNFSMAHNDLGVIYGNRGDLGRAIDHMEQAVRSDPTNIDAHFNLGVLLVKQGKLAPAAEHFEATLRLNPKHTRAENNLRYVRARLERAREGEAPAEP